jgi:hypothetical protein
MRFEISINGKRHCIAGQNAFGVLSAILSWVKRRPERFDPENRNMTLEDWTAEELRFDVGGIDNEDPDGSRQTSWNPKDGLVLKAGDEIVIRILPPGAYDEPTHRSPLYKDGI